ncbi:hypothetical protein COCVIDRAFT_86497 [Bipolaris victoriae FI3]|uniref:Uncharacterized protein n=1 Tax=Bipolaris victoriae (strain FI3) TaxID=930091 RepID=W7EUZ7_BIPV3|nr:hypothetical protein COCVIDRAFT_86497 [Bipolaris victoriae FI3]
MPVWAIGRLTHSLTQTCTPKTGDRRRLESLAGADKDRDKTRRRLCRPTRVHAQRGREWGEWIYFGAQHACVPDYRLSCPLQGRVRCPGGGHGGGEGVGFGQHSAEGARKRTRGPWAVGAGHMGRARGEGGGGVCVWFWCWPWLWEEGVVAMVVVEVVLVLDVDVCAAVGYATLHCAAALVLWCSATCDGARPWAAKGGSANDEASARPQVRGRATLLKPQFGPETLSCANRCPPRMHRRPCAAQ